MGALTPPQVTDALPQRFAADAGVVVAGTQLLQQPFGFLNVAVAQAALLEKRGALQHLVERRARRRFRPCRLRFRDHAGCRLPAWPGVTGS